MNIYQERTSLPMLANRIVAESACYREAGEARLVEVAWKYSNASNARIQAARNLEFFLAIGLSGEQFLVQSLERATATELTAHDALVKEFESYLRRRKGPIQ